MSDKLIPVNWELEYTLMYNEWCAVKSEAQGLEEQNRVLRERLAELEAELAKNTCTCAGLKDVGIYHCPQHGTFFND